MQLLFTPNPTEEKRIAVRTIEGSNGNIQALDEPLPQLHGMAPTAYGRYQLHGALWHLCYLWPLLYLHYSVLQRILSVFVGAWPICIKHWPGLGQGRAVIPELWIGAHQWGHKPNSGDLQDT